MKAGRDLGGAATAKDVRARRRSCYAEHLLDLDLDVDVVLDFNLDLVLDLEPAWFLVEVEVEV